MSNGVVKSTVVFLSEDQLLEAVARYLREPPFKFDFDDLEIVDITMTEEGEYRLELELFSDES